MFQILNRLLLVSGEGGFFIFNCQEIRPVVGSANIIKFRTYKFRKPPATLTYVSYSSYMVKNGLILLPRRGFLHAPQIRTIANK